MVKNPHTNAGAARDMSSIPGLGRSPGIGNGMSLYFLHMFIRSRLGNMGTLLG